jgi:serine/threonine protein kinase
LKLLPEALSRDDVFRKRLQREAHAAGRLAEPHVVPIHDFGEIDGVLYVDMRLIDGVDLHCLLSDGPLTPARAVAIVRQVAAALDAAHRAGVMHRDVKPENVLITRDDFACLVDFGLATATSDERLTQMGTMVGTFSYMAPERFRNKEMTSSSDIYSLACVLHECLTGSRPYKADSLSPLPARRAAHPGGGRAAAHTAVARSRLRRHRRGRVRGPQRDRRHPVAASPRGSSAADWSRSRRWSWRSFCCRRAS